MEPKRVTRPEMKMIGTAIQITHLQDGDLTSTKISNIWQKYFEEEVEESIPNKANTDTRFVVYTDYHSDQPGNYTYIIASEVHSLANTPEGMAGFTVPASDYLLFPVRSALPEALAIAWKQIGEYFATASDVQRMYTTDFELHKKDLPSEVDIYIAIK